MIKFTSKHFNGHVHCMESRDLKIVEVYGAFSCVLRYDVAGDRVIYSNLKAEAKEHERLLTAARRFHIFMTYRRGIVETKR